MTFLFIFMDSYIFTNAVTSKSYNGSLKNISKIKIKVHPKIRIVALRIFYLYVVLSDSIYK